MILMFFYSCEKEENSPPNNNNVYIKTLSHSILDGGGISLTGEIGNVELPIDYGFIISSIENDTYSANSNTKLLAGIKNGNFTLDFKSNLREGITYYYNTIAFKNGEYIYGNEKSFISNGSADPLIESTEPSKAHLGDTITINGKHFSEYPQVFFNTWSSKALIGNDTLIKCVVTNKPEYNTDKLPFIELKVRSNTGNETIFNEFALHTPKVDSIRPYEAFPGDIITIYGDHFNRQSSGNRLIIPRNTGTSAYPEVIRASQKELQFVLRSISSFEPTIIIESQSQSIEVKNEIKHILPQFERLSKNKIKYGDKLIVYGTNFPQNNSYAFDTLQYSFGTKHIPFYENHRDSLVIDIIDNWYYEDFSINGLSIDFFGHKIDYNQEIELDENYVRLQHYGQNISGRAYGQVGEDLYSIEHQNSNNLLVKLNKQTNLFDEVYTGEPISTSGYMKNISFNDTKFYWLESSNDEVLFFSYDIFTKAKEKLASFPGTDRTFALNTVVGEYLYYGLGGYSYTNPDNLDDIWRYSFSDNKWEFVLNFPEIDSDANAKQRPVYFSIGDKIYVGGGQSYFYPQLTDFWELDTKTNSVSRKSDLPIITSVKIEGLSFGGKGYFDFDGTTYIYDPIIDEWSSKKTSFTFNGYNRYLFKNEDFIYSMNNNSLIKIKKSYFNN
ncbi:IPT/TIG domain-containing protein [Neotamlana laminarinivorans]|uniref:IPT/TIG domain-containing protein n=1 Tax=Neotamlana laminarinivorans TaxID=2883124 RepID=A0A9X1HXH1_9FLAO|nr:IPT/TIG domain-containing protein [Tamlana laminarinivorans]MCB4797695.1 IPT/TIG domain-containing protein [Tamlana laminarinivorans]